MAGPIGETFATPDDFGDIRSSDLHASLGERLAAQAADALDPQSGLSAMQIFRRTRAALAGGDVAPPGPYLLDQAVPNDIELQDQIRAAQKAAIPDTAIEDARKRVKEEGLEGHLKLPDQPSIKSPVLDLMVAEAHERRDRELAIARGPQGFLPDALGFVTGIGAGMIDPVNMAAFSIPVVGEARFGRMLASAGESLAARAAVRAGVGAAQGAVGTAALQPADWWLHTQDGLDYTMADALHSIVMGAGMGAAFHAGFGAVGDVAARRAGRPLPGSPEAQLTEALATVPSAAHPAEVLADLPPRVREDALQTAVADGIEGNTVRTGEMLQEAAKDDPRIAESLRPRSLVAETPSGTTTVRRFGTFEPSAPALRTGQPHIDAVLSHPDVASAIENPKINRTQDVPYTAGPDKTGNGLNVDRHFPESFAVDDQGNVSATSVAGYHGTDADIAEPDIAFGGSRGGIPDERGTTFFSSTEKLAGLYGKNVIKKDIRLGKTAEFDASQLINDPQFVEDMRASFERTAMRNDALKEKAATPEGKAAIEKGWQSVLAKIEEWKQSGHVRYNPALSGAIIERAKAQGLDTAVIKNMAEGHGKASDQVVVLNNEMLKPGTGGKTFDPAEPFAVHEFSERHAMNQLTAGGMDEATAYKVAHWEVAEPAEGKWYESHGIDQAKAEAAYQPFIDKIEHEKLAKGDGDVPADLFRKPYPHDSVDAAAREKAPVPKPTAEEIARGREILAKGEGPSASEVRAAADWQRLADARRPDDDDLAVASRQADKIPELASVDPEKSPSAAEAAAKEADALVAELLPRLTEEERRIFEEALSKLDRDKAAEEQIARDAAACLAAAVA